MADRIELFERRNRLRIVALVVLATLNYIVDADSSRVRHVSRATGPLWLEFPTHVLGPFPSRATQRLARELLLDERIDHLCKLAGSPRRPVTRRR